MVEQAHDAVLLQGFLVVFVTDIYDTVFSVILWEFQALLSRRQRHKAQAGEQEQQQGQHSQEPLNTRHKSESEFSF